MGKQPETKAKWSQNVQSDALDLEPGVFTLDDPREIAHSLKRSAEASDRRKASPFCSAMSMLTFYINRAGAGLSSDRRHILERAKNELRRDFGRAPR
ncbi:hypothetical protein SJ05684_b45660 (plasmid) [Sinorhizobium sojae CCBAU 05684]|uniref:DUF3175 domain-containing protein n=1 Tax=Sinorhizobium sojae CCBAU 05684 TaxID=716928 RepID=A0A249PI06_9HYPH|nr:DUF3175 domain-containing protein [Sinorhizobium sojae]ASY65548.1 hypothetical protein SJ05684_b45660 [Sinorhizobium sojae CCBAU 05684]